MDNEMKERALELLKMDLGIKSTSKDVLFIGLIEAAELELKRKGILLEKTSDDVMLITDYTAWTYRKRQEDAPLSNNLQARIKNRVIRARAEKGG